MGSNSQPYAENGVMLSKTSLNVGDEIVVSYSGLLARSGAYQIIMHVGYGEEWHEKDFVTMNNEDGTFKASINVALAERLNIAFKDSADNWDNNSTMNYCFEVGKGSKTKKAATEKIKSDDIEDKNEEKVTKAAASKKKADSPKVESVKAKADKEDSKPAAKVVKKTATKTASKEKAEPAAKATKKSSKSAKE